MCGDVCGDLFEVMWERMPGTQKPCQVCNEMLVYLAGLGNYLKIVSRGRESSTIGDRGGCGSRTGGWGLFAGCLSIVLAHRQFVSLG